MMNKSIEEIVEFLIDKKLTITTAEYCTGGLIASGIVDIPGVSEIFNEGYVTYSNEAKKSLLGVKEETLDTVGAVSEETARQMAVGAAKAAKADVALSATGIAGPDGGTDEKPVGLVYLGCYCMGNTYVERHVFKGDRSEVRNAAVEAALTLAKKALKE